MVLLKNMNPLTKFSLGFFIFGSLIILAASLMLTGGTFIYSMDDPYIHLAVSEEILRGNYGINTTEKSSPSSSILYAYLLVPFVWAGLGNYAQLILSLIFQGVTLAVVANFVFGYVSKNLTSNLTLWYGLLGAALVMALNSLALPMTGMEHSLHVMLSVLIVRGLYKAERGEVASLWMVALITLNVLTRFEGLALSLASIVALWILGQRRIALVSLMVLVTALVAYGVFMTSMGLPLLPSSVMIKSAVSSSVYDSKLLEAAIRLARNVTENLTKILNVVLLALSAFMLWCCRKRINKCRATVLAVVFSIIGHIVLGSDGSMYRYEIYLIAIAIIALTLCFKGLKRADGNLQNVRVFALLLMTLGVVFLQSTILTPKGSQNIHDQQYQMHRFATEYFPEKVAVNDLGWVSYRNDTYVLDVYGLGSEQARKLHSTDGITQKNMATLVDDNGIVYAIIYDDVYEGAVPENWCRIAQLDTIMVTAAYGEVAFYLIDRSKEHQMRVALERFAATLPRQATMTTAPCT